MQSNRTPAPGRWTPLVAVSIGMFMLLLDVSIVNVALPAMARDLHTSFSQLQWVVDVYALALAALLLGIGSIADLVGRRRVYLAGLGLFALGSLASGAAPDVTVLIAARAVQGIGGAAMFATTSALLNVTYEGRQRSIAFGVYGAVIGAGAASGPIIGGLLTDALSWRWIFFVNLPLSAVAVALSLRALRESRTPGKARFDVLGTTVFTLSVGALTYALIHAGSVGWTSATTLGLGALSAAALVAFVLVERRAARPMLPPGLLRNRTFAGILIGALVLSFSAFAAFTYSSIWLQQVVGLSAIETGLAQAPMAVCTLVVSLLIGRFLHELPTRWPLGAGMLLISAGTLLQGGLDAGSGWQHLLLGEAVVGIGAGLSSPVLAAAAVSAVPPARAGTAAGAASTARQLGYAIGIALLGTIFAARIDDGGPLPATYASALNAVFLVAGVTGLVGTVLVVLFLSTRRSGDAERLADRSEAGLQLARR